MLKGEAIMMDDKYYIDYLSGRSREVEAMLRARMDEITADVPKQIKEAMEYSLMAGGKRLRPVMLIEAARACGASDTADAEIYACAIEMIHTSSLIHDDLPAMDDDDLRRGRPTSHKVFGEAMAILAGDALLNHASEIMAKHICLNTQPRFARAAYAITQATGISGMIGGQTIDVLAEKSGLDIASEELLTKIYSMKTCALLEGAVAAGAYIAGASEETVSKWRSYARCMGLAFQIVDDILDVVGDEAVIGKPIGSDSDNNKPTFVTLMGLDGAKNFAARYTEQAKTIAESFENAEFFVWLADYLCKRDR